jgi:hypothetical protein
MAKAYMVKYKVKMGGEYNHSDYDYQKIFRAIYGYTQNVTKGNGKIYIYHRPGILSKTPYIKKGKNEVIIPKDNLPSLLDFFKTGENPAHKWAEKGNWQATYTLYDVDISEQQAKKAIDKLINSVFIVDDEGLTKRIINVLEDLKENKVPSLPLKNILLTEMKKIHNLEWYSTISEKTNIMKQFEELSQNFKNKFIN